MAQVVAGENFQNNLYEVEKNLSEKLTLFKRDVVEMLQKRTSDALGGGNSLDEAATGEA